MTSVKSFIQEPFTIDNSVFYNYYETATLYVPEGTKSRYKAASAWNQFKSIEEFQNQQPTPTPKASAQTMVLHHANGSMTEVDLASKPVVRFQNEKVIVATTEGTSDYQKDNILRITYNYLRADVNGDNAVDVADIATVISVMAGNDVGGPVPARSVADVNGDGVVDVADIASVIDMMAELARRAQMPKKAEAATANGTIGEAFYIYRNDGQFNAFFREEIDSIGFSHYDADSLRYNKIASQVVYTPDSTYMIPLVAIDSVGFVQPETIVCNDVFPLTADHSPYISDADTLKFTMQAATPEALRPKVGNIVVATADCDAFPDGIVARVKSVVNTGTGLQYHCSKATLEDVFDQLVLYSKSVESIGETSASRGFDLRKASLTAELWNLNWSRTIEGGGTTTTLAVGDNASVTVTVRKTLTTPFFMQVELHNTLSADIDFKAKSSVGYFAQKQIGNTLSVGKITIPYTAGLLWLTPKISLYGYFQEEGSVELTYSGYFNRTDRLGFTYTEGEWSFYHTPTTNAGTDMAQLSMDGYAEVGLRPQIDFSLNGRKAGFGCSVSVRLKEYINFIFDMTKLSNGGLYDAMRDSYCRTTIPWSVTAHASADIFSRYDSNFSDVGFATFSHTFEPRVEPQWGEDRYIFPLFAGVEGKRQGEKATAKAGVSRTPLLPVQVGFSLIDKDKNIVQTKYDGRIYKAGSTFSNYSCDLSGLEGSEKYTVRPSVKLFGQDVLASPEAEVKDGETSCPDENHPHMIDLGLPSGTKWACCNVGASTPEGYGNYYAWGETSPKSNYGPSTYQFAVVDSNGVWYDSATGLWYSFTNIGSDIAGTGYDAATANWGSPWRMPSLAQIQELLNNTTSIWTTQNGVNGRKFTGNNGGSVFLPAAGYRWNGELHLAGSYGFFWSSTLDESNPDIAYSFLFNSGDAYWSNSYRLNGTTVRPVR